MYLEYYSIKRFFFFFLILQKLCHFLLFFCFFALLLNAFNWILKALLQPIFNKNRAKTKQD
ncbi:hypothetical protein [Helicobacter pylori]|uniref:hypothetical protein n=1 Tax=Helicobacter pylori TaxID=210 RepID=UPI001E3CBD56|nr:hypothetical protein [Helicobacter pylori]